MSRPQSTSQSGQRLGRPFADPSWRISDLSANTLYNRSLALVHGRGVPRNEAQAFALNAEAADAGHGDAVLAMGWFYLNGVGVTENVELARKWYRKSARRGEPRAMFSLGEIAYLEGDYLEALTWFQRASKTGHPASYYWLGKQYWRGHGVERDRKQAMRLFQRAASGGNPKAHRLLRFLT